MVIFRPPTAADIAALAASMREIDRLEVLAVSGRQPKDALAACVAESKWALAAEVDGRVMTIFGIADADFLGEEGSPWMLCAEGIERHARALLTYAPRHLARMKEAVTALRNMVHADNRSAIRFLKWCGFSFGEKINVKGEPFLMFAMEAADV